MVSSLKPSSDKKTEENNDLKDLESEINEVINSCKSIIKSNYGVIKKKQNADKNDKDVSKVTLESVAQDMSNILENLKTHIGTPYKKNDSYSDVIPKLEELIKHNQNTLGNANQSKNRTNKPTKNTPRPATPPKKTGKVNAMVNKPKQNVNKRLQNSRSNSASTSSKYLNPQVPRQRSNPSKSSISSKRKNVPNTRPRPSSAEKKNSRAQPAISRDIYDPLGVIKDEVERAKRAEKTFTIRGCFQAVRRALLNRGWIEKYHFTYRDRINEELKKYQHYSIQELCDMMRNKEIADLCKKLIKSKLLANHQVDFYWSYDYDGFRECPDKIKLTRINKIRRGGFSFTSKKGLCDASKKQWFNIPGLAHMNHPRTYNLVKNGDTSEFIRDFSLTAAMSLLKWILKNSLTHETKLISPSGKIPVAVFNFSVNECYKFIKKSRDEVDGEFPQVFEHEWNEFLENYYKIVQFGNHFKQVNGVTENDMIRKSNYIVTQLREHWPYLDMDGVMNIWILKPINGSQGVGIHICRTLKYILGVIKSNPNRRYIVQKYIERPLLIYNTKFDIRQWFLISSSVPLTIWIYRHSYLRFSSQTYSLRKLHESIHLTNNSVQCRYNKYQKDIALPHYNMWDSNQFKNYLSDIGYPNVFNDIIYPGMKQSITAAVLLHKDKMDRRKHCFEIQGADFILTEDFKPWLLEINSSPALHASTPVTARMCPAVLEDVIKVVVDYERNNKANTGGFELMFDERVHGATLKGHLQLVKVPPKTNYVHPHPLHELSDFMEIIPKQPNLSNVLDGDASEYIKQIGAGLRKTLDNLLQILKTEKQKRQLQNNKCIETILSNNIIAESRKLPVRKAEPVTPLDSPTDEKKLNMSYMSIAYVAKDNLLEANNITVEDKSTETIYMWVTQSETFLQNIAKDKFPQVIRKSKSEIFKSVSYYLPVREIKTNTKYESYELVITKTSYVYQNSGTLSTNQNIEMVRQDRKGKENKELPYDKSKYSSKKILERMSQSSRTNAKNHLPKLSNSIISSKKIRKSEQKSTAKRNKSNKQDNTAKKMSRSTKRSKDNIKRSKDNIKGDTKEIKMIIENTEPASKRKEYSIAKKVDAASDTENGIPNVRILPVHLDMYNKEHKIEKINSDKNQTVTYPKETIKKSLKQVLKQSMIRLLRRKNYSIVDITEVNT